MCLARDEQIRLRLAKSKPALLRLLRYPHANSAAGIFVLKDNPRLLKRGLDAHQGGDVSTNGTSTVRQINWLRFVKSGLACGRLFGLFWPLAIA